ncbi:hypothetical protein [Streptomyces sp. NPDC054975]
MTNDQQDSQSPEAGADNSPEPEPSPAPGGRGRGSGAAANNIVARLSGLGKKSAAKKTAAPAKKTAAKKTTTPASKPAAKKAAAKKATPAKKATTKKTAATPSVSHPYRKKGDWVYEEGVPVMPAEQDPPRSLYSARITFTTTEQQRRALEAAKLDDRIDKTARLRAMVALWEQDERLRKRVDKLARTMQ